MNVLPSPTVDAIMKQIPDSAVVVIPAGQTANVFRDDVPVDTGPSVRQLEFLASWMDNLFHVPGTQIRFGLDPLLGLIPGLGDTLTSIVSLYILQEASRRGVSRLTLTRMAANIGIDYVLGSVPVLGDAFDVYWKANQKNVELLKRHIEANPQSQRKNTGDWLFFAGLAGLLVTLLVGTITITWFVISGLWKLFNVH